MDFESFADDIFHLHSRIERTVWILKDHLKLSAQNAKVRARQVRDVLSLKQNLASGRLLKPYYGSP